MANCLEARTPKQNAKMELMKNFDAENPLVFADAKQTSASIISNGYGSDILQCPDCYKKYSEGSYTHAEGAYCLRSPNATAEFRPIPHVPLVDEREGTYRNAVAVLFWCEDCHGWFEVIFRQHKGQTFVSARMVAERMKLETEEPTPAADTLNTDGGAK